MAPGTRQQWVITLLHSLLVGGLAQPSSPPSRHLSVSSQVGSQAVLPCSWKKRLGEAALPDCHVQWATPDDTVFELCGERRWAAEEFQGRVEVPEARLGSGDCSLVISDVQLGDTGRYESYMVVDGTGATRTRFFIQSVRLSVFDHKSTMFRGPGEDLVLDLYTARSARVVFQDRNSSAWAVLWAREDGDSERLVKHLLGERLMMKKLSREDEGTYKVLDEHGLAVSTVQLYVKETDLKQEQAPTGDGAKVSCSALLVLSVLLRIIC